MGLTDDEIVNVSCFYCLTIISIRVPKEKNSAGRIMVSGYFATLHTYFIYSRRRLYVELKKTK